jgi:hypothetical protein
MNEPKKLTIRINFRAEKDSAPETNNRCTYHWGRIIGISLAAIVAIASLISAGSYYLNQDKIDSESVTDKSIASSLKKEAVQDASQKEPQLTATALSAVENSPPKIESKKTPSVPSNEPVIQAVEISASTFGNKNTTITAEKKVRTVKPAAVETKTAPTEVAVIKPAAVEKKTAPAEVAVIKPAAVDTAEEVAVIKPAAVDTAEEVAVIKPAAVDTAEEVAVINPAAAQKKSVSERLFTQSQKKSLSDNVTRFVISQAVEGNEPLGSIGKIHFDRNNIATVYAYSDVNGLKDQTIYYQWSLNGKNIAKIKVEVGAKRWRSYSSKFIQPDMHGEWKVELQNQAGENLAINQFNY